MSRPAQTYARNCQGCHGEAGVSVPEIPTLAGRVGYFARLPEGRSYLVQVPNVALNPSSDEAIAAMMNWMLLAFSRDQLPEDFQPYTTEEVGQLRTQRIDATARRAQVVDRLVAADQIPSADVLLAQAPSGSAAAGKEKYVQCASCHGSDGRSTVLGNYPKIGGQNPEYVVSALKAYRDKRRQGTYAAMMTEVAVRLSDEDIANLAAYIRTLAP